MGRSGNQSKATRAAARTVRLPAQLHSALLRRSDVRALILDLANNMAPGDVATLLRRERELRAKAARLDPKSLALLRDQLALALDCLRDHHNGDCPQIPYYTISLLAAAVYYFADELDVIPDFLPHAGHLDDAVVMAMACQLAEAGLRRYCTWKERDIEPLLRIKRGDTP